MALVDHPAVQEPGVRFGMPQEEYHAALALSAHGIANLRASSLDFWTRCHALNPALAEDAAVGNAKAEDSEARLIGRAYHARIVEGPQAFADQFASDIDPADHPGALRTVAELKEALATLGLPAKATERKADLIDRLVLAAPAIPVWDAIVADHVAACGGRTLLKPWLVAEIERAAEMIESHPQLHGAFTGGMPEVSVFWTDPATQVPMKARFDYLKPRAVVDLKSFANERRLPVRTAILRAFANYRYHIQAALYLEAAQMARQLIGQGHVSGEVDPGFLQAFHDAGETNYLLVFQQKKIRVVRGLLVGANILLDLANAEIEEAKATFRRCWELYGIEEWRDEEDITVLDPQEVPAWIRD
jgi:hypothetical protein